MATIDTITTDPIVKITPNDRVTRPENSPTSNHFHVGVLAGLKLIGFSIWEGRGAGRNVTFARPQYSVNLRCRSFALLRPIADVTAPDAIRDTILAV